MRTTTGGLLADTLFGRTRRQVLSLLYGRPDESFYVREVARATGSAPSAVQKELAALANAGILERSARGREVYFTANRNSPVFGELRSLVAKTSGVEFVIRDALKPLESRIAAAFLFGSVAKGEETAASDVDLFVIGLAGLGDVVDALGPAQQALGRDINPVVQMPAEFSRRVKAKDHFVTSVLAAPRLFVIGDQHGLEGLAAPAPITST